MPIITYVLRDGTRRDVDVEVGTSVMEAALLSNLRGVDGECGGCLSCATCHVYVDPESAAGLPPPGDEELELLEGVAADRLPSSRLGCQVLITDSLAGLVVTIPERQG
ncbi:2Fe-2S iron-sulfur cluster binding domain-containing protein [Pseudomonas moorei]|nr:2Fe-2S iron-sulfur cluster binding domain-containing protein [Pseudomonas moorei]